MDIRQNGKQKFPFTVSGKIRGLLKILIFKKKLRIMVQYHYIALSGNSTRPVIRLCVNGEAKQKLLAKFLDQCKINLFWECKKKLK
jgi:hypothetical protein